MPVGLPRGTVVGTDRGIGVRDTGVAVIGLIIILTIMPIITLPVGVRAEQAAEVRLTVLPQTGRVVTRRADRVAPLP